MAYIKIENLCSGMIMGRKLLDRNRRLLLPAGIALTRHHIQALRSLGIKGVEIRGGSQRQKQLTPPPVPAAHAPTRQNRSKPAKATTTLAKPVLEALQVNRPATKPLKVQLEPCIARQTRALLNELLKNTAIDKNSGVASVVKLCAIRVLRN